MSGRADSRGVSAIRVLAACESRREERTTLHPHVIMRDDLTVVLESANRRLTELALAALRTNMWLTARPLHRERSIDGRLRGPRLEWAACSATGYSEVWLRTHVNSARDSSNDGG